MSEFFKPEIFVDWVGVLLVALVSVITTSVANWYHRRSSTVGLTRERVDLVYSPLFQKIEPILYKNIHISELQATMTFFNSLLTKHPYLVNPTLKHLADDLCSFIEDGCSSDECLPKWKKFSAKLDGEYDSLCHRLNLPRRTSYYRLQYRQFKNKLHLSYLLIRYGFFHTLCFIAMCLLFLWLYSEWRR